MIFFKADYLIKTERKLCLFVAPPKNHVTPFSSSD